ncbi:MAG: carboxypeptidase regulatory-like domain-containing protein [Alphaproteobacteria bacterium]
MLITNRRDLKLIAGIAAIVAVTGLGAGAPAAAAAYKEIAVKNGGTIKGKVLLGSAETETTSFKISKDPKVCGTGNRDVPFVRANGKALLDAVVYLYKVKQGKPMPKAIMKIKINQKKCAFEPYMSVLGNGGDITVVNSDPTLHNIHTYELIGRARRTVINVSQPKMGDMFTKTIKLRRGPGMKLECDAHNFMHAFMFVARNPYYAVVDKNGGFTIKDVPPGKYKIRVWHGALGVKKAKVEVKAGGTASVTFSY